MFTKMIFWVLVVSVPLNVQGQLLNGTYKYGEQYLRFEKDSVYFKLRCCGGIYSDYEAVGSYEIKKNYLVIKPFIETPSYEIVKILREKNDSLYISPITNDTAIIYAGLVVYDKDKKIIYGQTIQTNERVFIKKNYADKIDSVKIVSIGYLPITTTIDTNYNYKVELLKGITKEEFESVLNTKSGGFKFKLKDKKIILFRPSLSTHPTKYYLQTYELQ